MTPEKAIEAIIARIQGEWDNKELVKFGELSTDTVNDILRICNEVELV